MGARWQKKWWLCQQLSPHFPRHFITPLAFGWGPWTDLPLQTDLELCFASPAGVSEISQLSITIIHHRNCLPTLDSSGLYEAVELEHTDNQGLRLLPDLYGDLDLPAKRPHYFLVSQPLAEKQVVLSILRTQAEGSLEKIHSEVLVLKCSGSSLPSWLCLLFSLPCSFPRLFLHSLWKMSNSSLFGAWL